MKLSKEVGYWPGTNQLTKSTKEVAKILNVHPNTIFRWVKAGKLECIRFRKNLIHFTYDQIMDFINRHREQVEIKI